MTSKRHRGSKLQGKTILVPESRELDLFAGMLTSQGARTIRCPLVTILDVTDSPPLEVWIKRLVHGEFDDLILMTGEGLRRLLALGERLGTRSKMIAALGEVRTIARGPKPTRALQEIGLSPRIKARVPTSAGVIETLSAHDLRGRKIGLQLYPDKIDDSLQEFLEASGATVFPVTPYRYASNCETSAVADAIKKMALGEIDVIAFTSSSQILRLLAVAKEAGLEEKLAVGWKRTSVASVGPVVTKTLNEIGVSVATQPETDYHLKPLVAAIIRLGDLS